MLQFINIIIIIWVFIFSILLYRWKDQIRQQKISYIKYHTVLITFSIGIIITLIVSNRSIIEIIIYSELTLFVIISYINTKTNDSDFSREDIRIWTGFTIILTLITGILAYTIDSSNSINDILHLLMLLSVIFYSMFFKPPHNYFPIGKTNN